MVNYDPHSVFALGLVNEDLYFVPIVNLWHGCFQVKPESRTVGRGGLETGHYLEMTT
jgi:hypothetical protein